MRLSLTHLANNSSRWFLCDTVGCVANVRWDCLGWEDFIVGVSNFRTVSEMCGEWSLAYGRWEQMSRFVRWRGFRGWV